MPDPISSYETVLLDRSGPVAVVTLNRPRVLNALNAQLFDELESVFSRLADDPEIRAVVLTGSGDRAFAAGADINELARTDAVSGERLALRGQAVFSRIESCGKPVIAAINGFALGGGCELALACTLRLAADHARLGQPEITLGLIPGYGGTQRLPRLVGRSAALRLLLTGDLIDAPEAFRIGLVDMVVPLADLPALALAIAGRIASLPPLAVAACLEAVRVGTDLPLDQALKTEAALFGRLCETEDKREGTAAFLEKRKPAWTGR